MKKFYISLFFLTFFATAGQAAVYKWVDEEGNLLRYSDVPQKPGDQPMDMPKPALEYDSKTPAAIPEFKPSTTSAPEKKPEESQPVTAYSAVTIMNIRDDEGVRANGGVFDIKLASQPALDADATTKASAPTAGSSTLNWPPNLRWMRTPGTVMPY